MADAVGAQHAFFSTCGSSLSVKAAMLAVAGHDGHLILGRDVHKSVTACLIFSGLEPCWVRPQWDSAVAYRPPALGVNSSRMHGTAHPSLLGRGSSALRRTEPARTSRRSPRSATRAGGR